METASNAAPWQMYAEVNPYWKSYLYDFQIEYKLFYLIPVALYLPALWIIKKYMDTRKKPVECKPLMLVWNLILGGGSAYGAYLLVPWMLERISTNGLHHMTCSAEWTHNRTATWVITWFTMSKVPELVDTLWLLLRKKTVITLHWYHHITVLSYVWYASMYSVTGSGAFFAAMNLCVHAVMYTYYAAMSAGYKIPFPWTITLLQISQMAAGTYLAWDSGNCGEEPSVYYAGLTMYASYYLLFCWFGFNRFCRRPATSSKNKSKMKSS
mmetsp:Transcript_144171/g.203907  ORF Transcript_144171/g.203907 Transcript_144171/m.203907 type:complete len:268 (-) Transcript_144171:11-814(-)